MNCLTPGSVLNYAMQTSSVSIGGSWTSSNLAITPRNGHCLATATIDWFSSKP